MIASFYPFGRLGNRLFIFSNLIAFSELHRVPVAMPAFSVYRGDFPRFDDNPDCWYRPDDSAFIGFPSAMSFRLGAWLRIFPTVRFWEKRDVYFDVEDAQDARVRTMIDSPRVVFEGWNFRSRTAIMDFRPRIKDVFSPRQRVLENVARKMAIMRQHGDMLVGVHVRWGDYRETDMFFELPEYLERMKEARSLLAPARVAFLIFSPEQVPTDALLENCHLYSGENAVEDLYALAECDLLIGPPSTFSMWASYYGGHPLFVMRAGRRFAEKTLATVATP